MNNLPILIEIMKLLKLEHELTLNITQQEIELFNFSDLDGDIVRIERSIEKLSLGLDDAHLLALIKTFLEHENEENITSKNDLYTIQDSCQEMKSELKVLSQRYNDNQQKIKLLELENIKLKEELHLDSFINKSLLMNPFSYTSFSQSSVLSSLNPNEQNEINRKKQFLKVKVPAKMKTLYDLVMQYMMKGHYGVAIPLCQQALYDIAKSNGKCCNEYATILHIMANVYRDVGDYQRSIDLMVEAFNIREQVADLPQSEILKTLNSLSVLHGLLYNWAESGKYCIKCIELIKQVHGVSDVRLGKELENMAIISKNDNKIEEAIYYFQEASDIYKANLQISDEMRMKDQMAECHFYLQNFESALNIYKSVYHVQYQSTVSAILGVQKPLWLIAESYERCDFLESHSMGFDWKVWQNNKDVNGNNFRDLLIKMSRVYKHRKMVKAANFLKSWINFNMSDGNKYGKLYRSSSLIQLNDDTLVPDKTCRNLMFVEPRRRTFSEQFRSIIFQIHSNQCKKEFENDLTRTEF